MASGDDGVAPAPVWLKVVMVFSALLDRSSLKIVPPLFGPPPDVVPKREPFLTSSAAAGFAPFAKSKRVSVVSSLVDGSSRNTVPSL